MYMYKMFVPTEKIKISKDVDIKLSDEWMSLNDLLSYNLGPLDYFTISEIDGQSYLQISYVRYETDEEFELRRQKAIKYNVRYDKYHAGKK